MKYVFSFIMITLFLVCCGPKLTRSKYEKDRSIVNNTIVSQKDPVISITVDSSLKYIGRFDFEIKADTNYEKKFWHQAIAAGERVVFANVVGNVAKGVFIAQFEGFLPSN